MRNTTSSFDIAPLAPRHSRASLRLLLAGSIVMLMGVTTCLYQYQRFQAASEAQAQQEKLVRAEKAAQRAASRAAVAAPGSAEASKAKQRIQGMVRTSWFGLFDALESAALSVRSSVSLLTLAPEPSTSGPRQVRITALAAAMPSLLDYLRALQKNPQIESAEIISQQLEPSLGPTVLRAQIALTWNPTAPLRPEAETTRAVPPSAHGASPSQGTPNPSVVLKSTPVKPLKATEVRP
jgi:hypothetical protein